MDYKQFNTQCLGITVENWPHPQVGLFTYVDEEWGMLSPIPPAEPLSKQVRCVDSDIYFRFKDLKLIKIIKYVENKTNTGAGGIGA
jgi:hypothetical protein